MDPNSLRTLNDIFFIAVERKRVCVASYKQAAKWVSISSHELYRYVVGVSYALREWGISKGDRVAILSENRPEWAFADFACLAMGVVDVPVYPTLTAEQTAHILRDAGARVAFCSTLEQMKKQHNVQVLLQRSLSNASTSIALPLPRPVLLLELPSVRSSPRSV